MDPEIFSRLGNLEGKLDALIATTTTLHQDLKEQRSDFHTTFLAHSEDDDRNFASVRREVRHLQRFQYILTGGGMVLGALGGYFLHLVRVLP